MADTIRLIEGVTTPLSAELLVQLEKYRALAKEEAAKTDDSQDLERDDLHTQVAATILTQRAITATRPGFNDGTKEQPYFGFGSDTWDALVRYINDKTLNLAAMQLEHARIAT